MGILLVYDVTDEQSFQNIRNWYQVTHYLSALELQQLLFAIYYWDDRISCERVSTLSVDCLLNPMINTHHRIRNIEQHAADNVDKILVGNKCDMIEEKVVATQTGQALADEYSIKFFETSAKSNINVKEAFTSIASDIKKRLIDNPKVNPQAGQGIRIDANSNNGRGRLNCCK